MATCTRATPSARIVADTDHAGQPCLSVLVEWRPVDGTLGRPCTGGYQLAADDRALAERLARAIDAGVAVTFDGVRTDINGASYVVSTTHFLMRKLNADLRRLGF